ncbi:MAG: hypothetical protein Q9211_001660 [Gyalolechia sp. 1 TL-2023]
MLPGARDVATPHGTMRVYEWGSEDGPKVILIHGDTTPAPVLGPIANDLVRKGCRVLMFGKLSKNQAAYSRIQAVCLIQPADRTFSLVDLWGRGYSDAPLHVRFDSRLYVTQVLDALASSSIPWTGIGSNGFAIIGYSLGGSIAMSFAAYFPNLVNSLILLAPGGILRKMPSGYDSFAFRHQRFYRWRYLRNLTGKLLDLDIAVGVHMNYSEPDRSLSAQNVTTAATSCKHPQKSAVDILAITQWQFDCHQGFVHSFLSNVQYGPIMNQQTDWHKVCEILRGDSSSTAALPNGSKLRGGRILTIFGKEDTIVVGNEVEQDLVRMLGGDEHLRVVWVPGSHSFPEANSHLVMEHITRFLDLKT